jgi:hypothetical protein
VQIPVLECQLADALKLADQQMCMLATLATARLAHREFSTELKAVYGYLNEKFGDHFMYDPLCCMPCHER